MKQLLVARPRFLQHVCIDIRIWEYEHVPCNGKTYKPITCVDKSNIATPSDGLRVVEWFHATYVIPLSFFRHNKYHSCQTGVCLGYMAIQLAQVGHRSLFHTCLSIWLVYVFVVIPISLSIYLSLSSMCVCVCVCNI